MKKFLFFFLLSGFIFSIKSYGQVEPKLTEKVFEYYSSGQYRLTYQELYSYDEDGDTLSIIKKNYDFTNSDIVLWRGDFFEYDDEKRVIKKIIKGITQKWICGFQIIGGSISMITMDVL